MTTKHLWKPLMWPEGLDQKTKKLLWSPNWSCVQCRAQHLTTCCYQPARCLSSQRKQVGHLGQINCSATKLTKAPKHQSTATCLTRNLMNKDFYRPVVPCSADLRIFLATNLTAGTAAQGDPSTFKWHAKVGWLRSRMGKVAGRNKQSTSIWLIPNRGWDRHTGILMVYFWNQTDEMSKWCYIVLLDELCIRWCQR